MKYSYWLLLIIIKFSSSTLLFKLKDTDPQCLGGDYSGTAIIFVKYKVFTPSRQNLNNILPYINIYFKNKSTNTILNNVHILMTKGKLTFKTQDTGLYEVCIQSKRSSVISDLKEDLFVNLKIAPDYYADEPIIEKAIKNQDLDIFNQKTQQVIALTKPIIENQLGQLEVENELSMKTLSNASFYKYLTFGQLFITIIIGLIQINNFRRFLKSLNLI